MLDIVKTVTCENGHTTTLRMPPVAYKMLLIAGFPFEGVCEECSKSGRRRARQIPDVRTRRMDE